jgi:hypothetical protein
MARTPRPPVVLLNALGNIRGEPLKRLLAADGIWLDIAMLEGASGLERLIAQIGRDRLLFGSHAPLFYAEAAHLKLKESTLTPEQSEAIRQGNAWRLAESARRPAQYNIRAEAHSDSARVS